MANSATLSSFVTNWRVGWLALAVGSASLGACAAHDTWDPPPDAPQIGLQRGAGWTVMAVVPPRLKGPQYNLQLKNGVLSGVISGGDAPGGGLHVTIKGDNAEGFGPHGPINMRVDNQTDRVVADGMWNGGRVHMVFETDSIRGTVVSNSAFAAKTDPVSLFGMETFRRNYNPLAAQIDPMPENTSCEYFLDRKSDDGALNGGSICAGLPQRTRLEVPVIVSKWMTQAELVTVIVAMLSSPAQVMYERVGPRFEASPAYDTGFGGGGIRTQRY